MRGGAIVRRSDGKRVRRIMASNEADKDKGRNGKMRLSFRNNKSFRLARRVDTHCRQFLQRDHCDSTRNTPLTTDSRVFERAENRRLTGPQWITVGSHDTYYPFPITQNNSEIKCNRSLSIHPSRSSSLKARQNIPRRLSFDQYLSKYAVAPLEIIVDDNDIECSSFSIFHFSNRSVEPSFH